jgi:hypothetical protein
MWVEEKGQWIAAMRRLATIKSFQTISLTQIIEKPSVRRSVRQYSQIAFQCQFNVTNRLVHCPNIALYVEVVGITFLGP